MFEKSHRRADYECVKLVRSGMYGWMGIGAFVLAYDALAIIHAGETLSSAHRRLSQRDRGSQVLLLCVHMLIAAHLYGKIPRKYDPFVAIGSGIEAIRVRQDVRSCT